MAALLDKQQDKLVWLLRENTSTPHHSLIVGTSDSLTGD